MGRTFDALSQSRGKRTPEEELLPPTTVRPSIERDVLRQLPDDLSAVDTPLERYEDLSRDREDVPFIEVGVNTPTPVTLKPPSVSRHPSPTLRLVMPPRPATSQSARSADLTVPSVSFFAIPESDTASGIAPSQVARELVAFHRPDHPVSGEYRKLLQAIREQSPPKMTPVWIFTSVENESDAATVLLNLAITVARTEQRRVLVIEANHERPLIASRLGAATLPGLRELLNRQIPLNVALHRTPQANMYTLPPGDARIAVSSESEARLPHLLEQLRHRFDVLLVSAPEWGPGAAEAWAPLGDAVYLVVHQDQWDRADVEAAHEGILNAGGRLRGYVTLQP